MKSPKKPDDNVPSKQAAPISTDPSSKHLISFAYNRKSYVTANLGGSSHGEKEIESMDDQDAHQINDYHSI